MGVDWLLDANDVEAVNIQAVGAAIQNITLAATALGIGSLWVCDILYAYPELREVLCETRPILAAVSLGYFAKVPEMPERRDLKEVIDWI